MLFSHFRSGRVVPTPPPAITTLPTGITYADLRGHRRLKEGYTGNLYRLTCATASPTTLDIGQDVNGKEDLSGVASWANGSTAIYIDGYYDQVTGSFCQQATSTKQPLFLADVSENGYKPGIFGFDAAGAGRFAQGMPSAAISVDRQNVGLFIVARPLGGGLSNQYASLNSSTPASVLALMSMPNNRYTLYTFGNQNGFTNHLPPVNKLAILGYVGTSGNTKLHVDSRVTTTTANSSAAAVTAFLGRNTTSTTSSTGMNAVAIVVTATAPSDSEADAIKAALDSMFSIGMTATRKNLMVACPHSEAFCWNEGVYNETKWKQVMPLISGKHLEIGMIGQNGKTILTQISQLTDLTRVYEAGLNRVIYHLGAPANDINTLSSGFANGDPTSITTWANTIYGRYVSLKDSLVSQGSNVRIIVETFWQPSSSWWGGTTQDKADKEQVRLQVNQLLRDNAAAQGWSVNDSATITLTGTLDDGIHLNRLGQYRVANDTLYPVLNPLLAA